MKRIPAILVSLALFGALCACGKGDTAPASGGTFTEESTVEQQIREQEEIIEETDITDQVESWRGQGDTGLVKDPGSYEARVIRSEADLSYCRGAFAGLSADDTARIIADEKGVVVLVEVASADVYLNYGVNRVVREEGRIFFEGSAVPNEGDGTQEDPEEAPPGSAHEYFLFYIPGTVYNDEEMFFNFD